MSRIIHVTALVLIILCYGSLLSAAQSLDHGNSIQPTSHQQTLGEKMVELARSVEGAPYEPKKGEYSNYKLMDGEAVKREGIDCSGLVFWAYNKAAGANTWRPSLKYPNDVCPKCIVDRYGAHDQWNDNKMWEFTKEFTEFPAESELKPGDLLYVNTKDRGATIDHVGIYAGNGIVIHSWGGGGVVEWSYDKWKETYKSDYFGYGRVKGSDNPLATIESPSSQETSQSAENKDDTDIEPVLLDVFSVGLPEKPPTKEEMQPISSSHSNAEESSAAVDALLIGTPQSPVVWLEKDTIKDAHTEELITSNKEPDTYPTSYKSTIPIPTGPAADALKAQGKYEEYMQNALQAAEERIAKDPQDGDAWRTKSLALYYLNRAAESETALAKANELSHGYASEDNRMTSEPKAAMIEVTDISQDLQQVKLPSAISDGLKPITQAIQPANYKEEPNIKESSSVLILYPTTSPPPDESVIGESPSIPTLYPTTTPPPYESETEEGSGIPTLYPTTSPPPDESNRKDGKPFGAGDMSFGAASSSSDVESSGFGTSSDESDLGGINFTSIRLNYVSLSPDDSGGVNFDLGLKAKKAEGTSPGVNITDATRIGAIAFMTGLAVPSDKFWVNLDPWEPDRIIDDDLKSSEVGRIMLEADFQMKKDFCNYENPCVSQVGKNFWMFLDGKRKALVQQCMRKFPGEIKDIDNVYFRPVTRHWIIPDKVYAHTNGTEIYIINATLTISSDPVIDHSSFVVNNQDAQILSRGCLEELNRSAGEFSEYAKYLQDSMILPHVIMDINHAERYEDLRNVYVALALAQWYKSSITSKKDIFQESFDSSDSLSFDGEGSWSPHKIWDDLVYSFENGEYKCWENTTDKSQLRSSGGVGFYNINDKYVDLGKMPLEVEDIVKGAIVDGYIDMGSDVVFGIRLHGDVSSGSLEASIKKDPNLAILWNNKGNTFYDQEKYYDAIEAYDEAILRDSTLAIAWSNKGNVLINQGKYDDAIEAYNEAIRIDPSLETAKSNLAIAWSKKGDMLSSQEKFDDAIEAYNEAIRIDPNLETARLNLAATWNNKGNELYNLGKYVDAVEAYDKAIAMNPESASTWYNKGNALNILGRISEAEAAYAKARELG